MKDKIINWLKRHKVIAISSFLALVLVLSAMPVFAALEYLDITGTYTVTSPAVPRYLDNTMHPRVQFGELTITTQEGKVISDATLEHMGADIDLDGLVGAGSRPNITLYGTDSDGTQVMIQGKIVSRAGDVASIMGRITGLVESDGERVVYGGNGSSAISVAAFHSEPLSTLLTAGTLANPEALLFHFPVNRMKLSQLANLSAGKLGFWFNLQNAEGPGPQMMLRFAPAGGNTRSYYGGGTSGLVDITIMPYQAPYTGDGTWKQCQITSTSAICGYYGNDPTDYDSFDGGFAGENYTLAEIEAAINAEAAMVAGLDSCSNWVLTMVSVELWEGGARTCYVDDVTIGGQLYTLEPNNYYSNFKAIMQE